MAKTTEKARQAVLSNKEKLREERSIALYDYIEDHPGETPYSLSKTFNLALGTVQSLIKDLDQENLIKIIPSIDQGRVKKKLYVRNFEDFHFVDYYDHELNDPLVQQLIEKTRTTGISVFIHRKDGSKIELTSQKSKS